MAVDDVLRIANGSGFYGDRLDAPRELLEGGPIDVLTGDYLAELTMLILWRGRQRDADAGYARTFVRQMRDCARLVADRGVRVVVNAGGLNPAGLAGALRELFADQGVALTVAHVEGDDVLARIDELQAAGTLLANLDTGQALADAAMTPLTANAYLGAWGIVEALREGAHVVVCPRVTDASLVVGPAAWHFGWGRQDLDALAGAVVAGHAIECGAQATGGNYSFFTEVDGLTRPGFPIAEVHADGSSVITKHPGTGGLVSVGTVTAQLLYEIAAPAYLNPDVTARFDTIELGDLGDDRVGISGVRGEPPTASLKVCVNMLGGFRNTASFLLTGLDIEDKADLLRATLGEQVAVDEIDEVDVRLIRSDHPDAAANPEATAELRITVKDADVDKVGRRAFSAPLVELALATYPGATMTAPPADATPFGVYWPALVAKDEIREVVVTADGRRLAIAQTPGGDQATAPAAFPGPIEPPDDICTSLPTRRMPIGRLVGARSGDKGGNANLGVWARTDAAHAWLRTFLTVERLRLLLPETATLRVTRHELANLRALNFVIFGLLGQGVSSSTRPDPQAKGLGEWLRSRTVDVPVALL